MADGPPAPTASLLAVGGLVLLLRDDCLDVVFAQVGAVGAGRVGLVCGDRARPGAGTADGQADADLVEYGDELRAVRGLSGGQAERQRPAPAVGGEMDFAGQAAAGPSEQGLFQAEPVSPADTSAFFPLRPVSGVLSVVFRLAAPFCRVCSCSAAASSRASMTSLPTSIPAAS